MNLSSSVSELSGTEALIRALLDVFKVLRRNYHVWFTKRHNVDGKKKSPKQIAHALAELQRLRRTAAPASLQRKTPIFAENEIFIFQHFSSYTR